VTNGVFFFFNFCLLCSGADQCYLLVCVAFLIRDRYSDLVNLMAAAEVAAALGTSAGGAQSPSDPAGGAQSQPSFTHGRPRSGRGKTMPPRSRSGTPSPPRTRSGGVPSACEPPIPKHPPRRRSRPDGSGAAAGVAVTTATAATPSGGPPRRQSSRSPIPAADASIPPRLPSASPAPRSLRTGPSVVDGDGDRGSHALLPHPAVLPPPPALPSPSPPSHSGCAPPLYASPPATFSTSPHPPSLPR